MSHRQTILLSIGFIGVTAIVFGVDCFYKTSAAVRVFHYNEGLLAIGEDLFASIYFPVITIFRPIQRLIDPGQPLNVGIVSFLTSMILAPVFATLVERKAIGPSRERLYCICYSVIVLLVLMAAFAYTHWITRRHNAPNKTDAGNGSKAICRVSNVSRSPSPDPGR